MPEEVLKTTIESPKVLKSAFDSIMNIVDEVKIKADEKGLTLYSLDRGKVTYIILTLSKNYFESYSCSEPIEFAFDTEEFMKILKRGKATDKVLLSTNGEELTIIYQGKSKRTFKLTLIEFGADIPSPPTLKYEISIEIPFKELKESFGDSKTFNDNCEFIVEQERFIINSTGSVGRTSYEYPLELNKELKEPIRSEYSLEKLELMMKAKDISPDVKINMGVDFPLFLEIGIKQQVYMAFLLAPRIEED